MLTEVPNITVLLLQAASDPETPLFAVQLLRITIEDICLNSSDLEQVSYCFCVLPYQTLIYCLIRCRRFILVSSQFLQRCRSRIDATWYPVALVVPLTLPCWRSGWLAVCSPNLISNWTWCVLPACCSISSLF